MPREKKKNARRPYLPHLHLQAPPRPSTPRHALPPPATGPPPCAAPAGPPPRAAPACHRSSAVRRPRRAPPPPLRLSTTGDTRRRRRTFPQLVSLLLLCPPLFVTRPTPSKRAGGAGVRRNGPASGKSRGGGAKTDGFRRGIDGSGDWCGSLLDGGGWCPTHPEKERDWA